VFISHAGDQAQAFAGFLLKEFNDRYPAVKVLLDDGCAPKSAAVQDEMLPAAEDALVGELAHAGMILLQDILHRIHPMLGRYVLAGLLHIPLCLSSVANRHLALLTLYFQS
jgi:hypothetical protein